MKKLILEFLLGTPHLVGYGSQKEFPFDACTYWGSLFLHFFRKFQISCVSKNPIKYASSGVVFGSQFSIFLGFLAVIFALLVLGYLMELHSKVLFFQNRTDFLKFFNFIACAKTLLNRPHLGWCSAVNLWRNSTRFVGFLAVIFTSQWLLASRNHWGLRKAKNSLQKFINSDKDSGEF